MKSFLLALSLVIASAAQATPVYVPLTVMPGSLDFIKAHGFEIYSHQDTGTQRQQQQYNQQPQISQDGCIYHHETVEQWSYQETFNAGEVVASGQIQSARAPAPVLMVDSTLERNPLVQYVLSLAGSADFTLKCTVTGNVVRGAPSNRQQRRIVGVDQQCMEDCTRNGITYCSQVCARTEPANCASTTGVQYYGSCQVE